MLNKKGISPLIATVLIIGFTIVIAVLVITWVNNLVGDQTDVQQCQADAASKCTSYVNLVTATALFDGTNTIASVSNGASENVNVVINYISATEITMDTEIIDAVTGDSTIGTGTAGQAAIIKYLVRVSGAYKDTTCDAACGDGSEVVVATL